MPESNSTKVAVLGAEALLRTIKASEAGSFDDGDDDTPPSWDAIERALAATGDSAIPSTAHGLALLASRDALADAPRWMRLVATKHECVDAPLFYALVARGVADGRVRVTRASDVSALLVGAALANSATLMRATLAAHPEAARAQFDKAFEAACAPSVDAHAPRALDALLASSDRHIALSDPFLAITSANTPATAVYFARLYCSLLRVTPTHAPNEYFIERATECTRESRARSLRTLYTTAVVLGYARVVRALLADADVRAALDADARAVRDDIVRRAQFRSPRTYPSRAERFDALAAHAHFQHDAETLAPLVERLYVAGNKPSLLLETSAAECPAALVDAADAQSVAVVVRDDPRAPTRILLALARPNAEALARALVAEYVERAPLGTLLATARDVVNAQWRALIVHVSAARVAVLGDAPESAARILSQLVATGHNGIALAARLVVEARWPVDDASALLDAMVHSNATTRTFVARLCADASAVPLEHSAKRARTLPFEDQ